MRVKTFFATIMLVALCFAGCGNNNPNIKTNSGDGIKNGAITKAVFTINSQGDKVCFSQGNVQYNGEKYRFAENQYDYIEETSGEWTDFFTYEEACNIKIDGDWRLLTKDEWSYLINHNFNNWTTVCGVNGLVIVPQDWERPSNVSWGLTDYFMSDWINLQKSGAVFLPAAGYSHITSCYGYVCETHVEGAGSYGFYWSSTPYDDYKAYYLNFGSDIPNSPHDGNRSSSQSVRLVR